MWRENYIALDSSVDNGINSLTDPNQKAGSYQFENAVETEIFSLQRSYGIWVPMDYQHLRTVLNGKFYASKNQM